jgi:hypothetical protein
MRARFDVVMAWALDRLGRSLADLIDTLRTLEGAHVDLSLHQQAIDTTTPGGRRARCTSTPCCASASDGITGCSSLARTKTMWRNMALATEFACITSLSHKGDRVSASWQSVGSLSAGKRQHLSRVSARFPAVSSPHPRGGLLGRPSGTRHCGWPDSGTKRTAGDRSGRTGSVVFMTRSRGLARRD